MTDTPAPQATNPPVTIGEYTDVPAPGSPIASPWAQEATQRTVHRFVSTADRDAKYNANAAGNGAVCAVGAAFYVSTGGAWVLLAPQTAVDGVTASTRRMGCALTGPSGSTGPGAQAILNFTGVTQDTDGLFSGSAPTKVTLPAAGIWAANVNVNISGGTTGAGAVDFAINSAYSMGVAAKFISGSASWTIVRSFGVGTTIGPRLYTDSGSPTVSWSGTTFDVWRISP